MTTIACKDGHIACDSCWTDTNWVAGTLRNKITHLRSGALLGEAGDNDSRAVVKLLQNVQSFDQIPDARTLAACQVDYAAIILFPDGEMAQIAIERDGDTGAIYKAQAYPVNRGMTAVGSGAQLALGFMGAGRTAAEAVAFAAEWDPNSKVPVHDFTCDPPSPPERASRKTQRKGSKSRPSKASRSKTSRSRSRHSTRTRSR
jgi:hypothetical protein